jgi:hypothetical protein
VSLPLATSEAPRPRRTERTNDLIWSEFMVKKSSPAGALVRSRLVACKAL